MNIFLKDNVVGVAAWSLNQSCHRKDDWDDRIFGIHTAGILFKNAKNSRNLQKNKYFHSNKKIEFSAGALV